MKYVAFTFLLATIANASPSDIHCNNGKIKASLSEMKDRRYHLRVERVDGQPLSSQAHPYWQGFSLVLKKGECHGNYCSLKTDKHPDFAAWGKSGSLNLSAPKRLQLLYSYRFHFESLFEINGQEVSVDLQESFGNTHCLDDF